MLCPVAGFGGALPRLPACRKKQRRGCPWASPSLFLFTTGRIMPAPGSRAGHAMMALGVFGPALFLARLLGPLDIAAHLGFEIPGHQLLLGRIAAEVFVLFHIDAVIGQMAGRQGAGRLAAQAAGDGVVGDGFRGIEDQIGLGEDLFGGRGGLLFLRLFPDFSVDFRVFCRRLLWTHCEGQSLSPMVL